MATAENRFFIWEENDSIDQRKSLSKNVENVNCGITTETKSNLIESDVRDTTKVSGIYKIINKINGKYYVGSSVDIRSRWNQHKNRLAEGIHDNDHLQHAWNKYGKPAFDWIVVKELEPDVKILSQSEDEYLSIAAKEPDKSYNLNFRSRGNGLSEESKRKLSKSLTGRKLKETTKEKLSNLLSGINHPGSDKAIHTFHNTLTDENFTGTRFDFCTKFNLRKSDVCNLISGNRNKKRVARWVMKSPLKVLPKSRNDKTIYAFRNLQTGEVFIGIRSDFIRLHPKIHPSNVWGSLKHKTPTRGWNITPFIQKSP